MKIHTAFNGLLLALFATSAGAQVYPVKPVRMIVPAGPGGGVDTITRFVGMPLAAALGQPVVVENRPGAGTMVASELLAKGYQADAWYGVLVPARTPPDVVQRLNRDIVAVLRTADFRDKAATQGAEVIGGTAEEFGAFMRSDLRKWAKVTSTLKLQIE